jgi:phage gp29-like protein
MTDQAQKPELNEIATIARDVTYPSYGGVLRHQDDTLETRGGSKGLKIYDEIERDCTVYGDLQKRKQAVIGRPWQVDPASDSRIDKKAADLVRAQLESEALNFDSVCLNLLDALLKGYAVGEVMWAVDGAELVVSEIKPRNQRRFLFGDDYRIRMKTLTNFVKGEELPERKFIVHSFGAKDGSPYGVGLGTRLFWPAFFKRQGIGFWLTFADKFGSPTAVGTYPHGSQPADQKTLLDALGAISQDAGVIVPEGMVITLLEAARSGGGDTYEKLLRYMDEQITFSILGESSVSKGGGGQAASAAITRNEVRLELVQADSDLLSATLNSTLIKWISEYNCPGATPPRVWRNVEEQKDLGAVAERDTKIYALGFQPSLAYILETYGGEWTERKITPPSPAAPGTDAGPAFSENAQAILAAKGDIEFADAWDAVMNHVNGLVAAAPSMDALQDALVNAYGGLPLEDLRKVMAQGFQVAALAGVADVKQEAL